MRVVVAGATGFVGRALLARLSPHAQVIGLSRSAREDRDGVVFRACDLFSVLQAERALEGADVAVYLVHSMLPQARLTQGSFEDLDLLLADNFARAAAKVGVQRIVYLGGLLPDGDELSPHLRSRFEVEQALAAHGAEVVALRAGLVLGPGGSSFDMVARLVDRLPVMICPSWTSTLSQPVALEDVLQVLQRVVLDPSLPPGDYDLGGPDRLSYLDLMAMTAQKLGVKRRFLPVSVFSPRLSLLWLRLVTGAPRQLVRPLVESLRHAMLARDHRIFERYGLTPTPISDALEQALSGRPGARAPATSRLAEMKRAPLQVRNRGVCSVQRMHLARDESAAALANRYARWLVAALRPWLQVSNDDSGSLRFNLFRAEPRGLTLLELTRAADRSSPDRELFYITGGLLAKVSNARGRFELRRLPGRAELIAAIHDYVPALPWRIYRLTQAPFHLWVMRAFARHLASLPPTSPK